VKKTILIFVTALIFMAACGMNLYKPLAKKSGDAYFLQEARDSLDAQHYDDALDSLNKVQNSSNDEVMLKVSAQLGQAGLSLWTLLLNLIDNGNLDNVSGTGVDKFFNSLTDSYFGTGSERDARITAISNGISELSALTNTDQRIDNFRCFLTGLLVVPVITTGTTAIDDMATALKDLESSVVGTGTTAAQCPNLGEFNTALGNLTAVQQSLNLILAQAYSCPIFQSLISQVDFNSVDASLNKFIQGADKGCQPVVSCSADNPICQALQFGCVQSIIGSTGTAVAGDHKIALCEIVQNCSTPGACF
jgi:hypothetical protein